MVLADGFAWKDKVYPSLTKVAFAMTGTRWNGPGSLACGTNRPLRAAMKNGTAKSVRCAIYTRVSTDQGLSRTSTLSTPNAMLRRPTSEAKPMPRGP